MGSAVGQGAGGPPGDHALGRRVRDDAGHREAHAQRRRHRRGRARPCSARGARRLADQHGQVAHAASISSGWSRSRGSAARSTNGGYCGPAVKPIALHLLRQLARAPRRRPAAHLRHRRHLELARRRRVHRARRDERPGLHRGDALRLPHRRGHDRGPQRLARRSRDALGERAARQGGPAGPGVGRARPLVPRGRGHQRRQVHRVPALLRRLHGRGAPVHPPAGERHGGGGRARRATPTSRRSSRIAR